VIVQYGNYTRADRQYVKVRDVINGGYERYIEGLDSATAQGTEYYFVGRQIGSYNNRPRWFIGDSDSSIEYIDGKFKLKHVTLSLDSNIGDSGTTIGSVIDDISNVADSVTSENLLLNSAFNDCNPKADATDTNNKASHWGLGKYASIDTSTERQLNGHNSVKISRDSEDSDDWYNNGIVQRYSNDNPMLAVTPGQWVTFSLYLFLDDISDFSDTEGDIWLCTGFSSGDDEEVDISFKNIKPSIASQWVRKSVTCQVPDGAERAYFYAFARGNGTVWFAQPKLEISNRVTDWVRSPRDFDVLRSALQNSTTIDGGLFLGSVIMLGEDTTSGKNIRAGLSGIRNDSMGDRSPAFFAGGEMIDRATDSTGAKAMIRHDGSAYFSSNTVRFDEDTVAVGENDTIILDKQGLHMLDNGVEHHSIINQSIGSVDDATAASSYPINHTVVISTVTYADLGKWRLLYNENYQDDPPTASYFRVGYYDGDNPNKLINTPLKLTAGTTMSLTIKANGTITSNDENGPQGALITTALCVAKFSSEEDTSLGTTVYEKQVTAYPVVQHPYENNPSYMQFGVDASQTILFTVPEDGYYMFLFGIVNDTSVEFTAADEVDSNNPVHLEVEYKGTINRGYSNQLINGNDGMLSVWHSDSLSISSVLYHSATDFLVRVGSYGLRISATNGIQINRGDGNGFVNL
jgi:hypothetical protein